MKIETFDFDTKKQIMINVNNSLMEETMDVKNICNFDNIFYKVSYAEVDFDIFLYNLWEKIKSYVKKYYEINKDKLKELLSFINNQLKSLTKNIDINKVLIKTKENNNGK